MEEEWRSASYVSKNEKSSRVYQEGVSYSSLLCKNAYQKLQTISSI